MSDYIRTDNSKVIANLQNENTALRELIERLKCCGNCIHNDGQYHCGSCVNLDKWELK